MPSALPKTQQDISLPPRPKEFDLRDLLEDGGDIVMDKPSHANQVTELLSKMMEAEPTLN